MVLVLALALAVLPSAAQEPGEQYLAMTFDDGPSGRFTRRLLQELEQREAHVTFFLCGYRMEQYPDMAAEMIAAGHEIGLHGYSHTCMADMSMEKLEQELCRTEALLQEQTGTTTCLLRPPGGKRCQTVTQGAAAMAFLSLPGLWTPRTGPPMTGTRWCSAYWTVSVMGILF